MLGEALSIGELLGREASDVLSDVVLVEVGCGSRLVDVLDVRWPCRT